jgi:hypothetical protein
MELWNRRVSKEVWRNEEKDQTGNVKQNPKVCQQK